MVLPALSGGGQRLVTARGTQYGGWSWEHPGGWLTQEVEPWLFIAARGVGGAEPSEYLWGTPPQAQFARTGCIAAIHGGVLAAQGLASGFTLPAIDVPSGSYVVAFCSCGIPPGDLSESMECSGLTMQAQHAADGRVDQLMRLYFPGIDRPAQASAVAAGYPTAGALQGAFSRTSGTDAVTWAAAFVTPP